MSHKTAWLVRSYSSQLSNGCWCSKKNKLGSGRLSDSALKTTTRIIISNQEMNNIIKIAQALESSGVLLKGVTETIKNETKEQKGGFLSMLLGTLGASLL